MRCHHRPKLEAQILVNKNTRATHLSYLNTHLKLLKHSLTVNMSHCWQCLHVSLWSAHVANGDLCI